MYRVTSTTFISSGTSTAIPREFSSAKKALNFANKSFGAIEMMVDGAWQPITRRELRKLVADLP